MEIELVKAPDPVLLQRAKRVERMSDVIDLAKAMLVKMEEWGGVGLAAPQVGHSVRLFVASETGKAADAKVFINPMLVEKAVDGYEVAEEGCLSLPGQPFRVKRARSIAVIATDIRGEAFSLDHVTGWMARICQHEHDHLNGRLISDVGEKGSNGEF
jgi:peptide deformylase